MSQIENIGTLDLTYMMASHRITWDFEDRVGFGNM